MALWRIRATVDDRPGYLSVLTASLALRSVNILAVQVHTTEDGAVDDFLVDAPDTMSEPELHAAIIRGRGRDAFVTRAEAQGLADQPTRALALAGRLVHDPDGLGEALLALLDAAEVRWRPAGTVVLHGFDEQHMTLIDPAGGTYEVVRPAPAFTPAEYARAQALVEVSSALVRRTAEQTTLLLADGAELLVREATAEDLDAVRTLHATCSPESRRRRYLTAEPTETRLHRLIEPSAGLTLLALHLDPASGEERVVAMANLLTEGDLAEVAVLVADPWQRRGIGTALLRRAVAAAERAEVEAVVAHIGADNVAALRTLRRFGAEPGERDGGLTTVTLHLPGRRPAAKEAPATFG
ncbi:GNAT family N-acetyltransferase [Actinoplanes sp. TFC3]|uniref:GNAT family N-acetyltransferase n=1 Tax=Actinoplanes sp. TFC3 TaxID=1710355 RepID=UPI00083051B7|nr:GNAT family N-acetyltransferase [Actinoplanes sp. TFC3]